MGGLLVTCDVSELFLEGIGGDCEDLDQTHRDVQTSVRAVATGWLHHACVDNDYDQGVTMMTIW